MRLVKVHLQGYRRFAARSTLAVGGRVTALIGPNEAGKSSLLSAIARFGGDSLPLGADDLHPNRTSTAAPVLELEYVLNEEERELVGLRHGGWPYTERPARLFLSLSATGRREIRLDPPAVPDPTLEQKILTLLEELRASGTGLKAQTDLAELLAVMQVYPVSTSAATVTLGLRQASLSDPLSLTALRQLVTNLHHAPQEVEARLPRALTVYRAAIDHYLHLQGLRQRPATDLVLDAVSLPRILKLTQDARELASETPLAAIDDHSGMGNLLTWAGLNLEQLRGWVSTGEELQVATALARASRRLTEALRRSWPFEPIGVTLQLKEASLRLMIEPVGDLPFERPERRSDGLRLFLALLAFLHRYRAEPEPVILLIDELELHLHVDAQREVVKLLEHQGLVGQVIYSTHSPFALPTDLTSLRAVRPDPQVGTSSVNNRIWADRRDDQREGLVRLLTQMGAGAALFNAAHAVLVTEGVTDVALLPRMLAEALGWPTLGVLTVPGYAEARDVLTFEPQGARVAYLFDGDAQGRRYQQDVWQALARRQGRATLAELSPEDHARVLTLEAGHDLEDYLHPELYAAAVNHHLRTYQLVAQPMTAAELPATDRPAYVKGWAVAQGLQAEHLDKRSVTEALLDMWWDVSDRLDPLRLTELSDIAWQVVRALNLSLPGEDRIG